MSLLNAPKALYKAQQAKKKMEKIQAAGQSGYVAVLLNGLNDIVAVELNIDAMAEEFEIDKSKLANLSKKLEDDVKKSFEDAKKQIEKELVSSTSLEDLKGLLS